MPTQLGLLTALQYDLYALSPHPSIHPTHRPTALFPSSNSPHTHALCHLLHLCSPQRHLNDNSLDYPQTSSTLIAQVCASAFCLGLPPQSCTAFRDVQQSLTNPSVCVDCSGAWRVQIVVAFTILAGAIAALVVIIRLSLRHPTALRKWVSTVVILYNHTQTLAIINSLGVQWPPWVETIAHVLTLTTNFLHVPAASCLVGSIRGGDNTSVSSAITTSLYTGLSFLLLSVLALYGWLMRCWGRLERADTAELILSCVLVLSWNVDHASAIVQAGATATFTSGVASTIYFHGYTPYVSTGTASALLLLQIVLAARFWRRVRRYAVGVRAGTWHAPSCSTGVPIPPRRLARQVAFLTGRFAPHAPSWQFVIWLRQAALFATALAAQLMFPRLELGEAETARYWFALTAAAITLAAWLLHRRTQPFAYRYQNVLDEWLYASVIALLALVSIYAAIPRESPVSTLFEVLLLTVLLGSLVGGAAFAVYQLRATAHTLAAINLSDMLLTADERIDEPVHARLLDGSIRLLRCDWLLATESNAHLTRNESGAVLVKRRQEMPEAAYFSPVEAAALFRRGDRSVLVLSSRWLTGAHPDPLGTTLAALRRYLVNERLAAAGLFWDYAALPQRGKDGSPRSPTEQDCFKAGLGVMGSFYASLTGTTVLQLKDVPPRPPAFDGCLMLYNTTESEVALREKLGVFGQLTRLEVAPTGGEVHVRFASHQHAEECVAAQLKAGRAASLTYNATHYDRDGGRPYSGWCTFEQGLALLATAHLSAAEAQAHGKARALSPRLMTAQASRPKAVDISAGGARTREATASAPVLLTETNAAIAHATFIGKGDKANVMQMLAEFEWTMKTAMEQAGQSAEDGLTVPPAVLNRLLAQVQLSMKMRLSRARRLVSLRHHSEAPPNAHITSTSTTEHELGTSRGTSRGTSMSAIL